jgi:hypothetical protein
MRQQHTVKAAGREPVCQIGAARVDQQAQPRNL